MKQFVRRIEDFTCVVCGQNVSGNGYTNHCPHCLSSLHVDIQPGDRACDCGGVMRAVGYEQRNGKEWILHRCEKCGFERRNQVSAADERAAVRALASGGLDAYLADHRPSCNK